MIKRISQLLLSEDIEHVHQGVELLIDLNDHALWAHYLHELSMNAKGIMQIGNDSIFYDLKPHGRIAALYVICNSAQSNKIQELDLNRFYNLKRLDLVHILPQLSRLKIRSCYTLVLDELQKALHLKRLHFCDFSFHSSENLSMCKQLHALSMRSCKIGKKLDELIHCQQLKHLRIRSCTIQSIASIKKFTQLRSLSIRNHIINDVDLFQNLTQLVNLHLEIHTLQDLSILRHCKQLKALGLRGYQADHIDGIQELTQLTALNLHHCRSLTHLNAIQHLSQLRTLHFNQCTALSSLDVIQHLPNIQRLTMYGYSWELTAGSEKIAHITQVLHIPKLKTVLLSEDLDTVYQGLNLIELLDEELIWEYFIHDLVIDEEGCIKIGNRSVLRYAFHRYIIALFLLCQSGHASHIKKLVLDGWCSSIRDLTHLNMLSYLPHLEILIIEYCRKLTNIDALIHCKQLTHLKISSCDHSLLDLLHTLIDELSVTHLKTSSLSLKTFEEIKFYLNERKNST